MWTIKTLNSDKWALMQVTFDKPEKSRSVFPHTA